jgi:hypothetical protein
LRIEGSQAAKGEANSSTQFLSHILLPLKTPIQWNVFCSGGFLDERSMIVLLPKQGYKRMTKKNKRTPIPKEMGHDVQRSGDLLLCSAFQPAIELVDRNTAGASKFMDRQPFLPNELVDFGAPEPQ